MKKLRHQKHIICDFISVMFKKLRKLIVCDRRQDNGFLQGEGQIVAGKESNGDDVADGHVLLIDLVACATYKLYYLCILCMHFIFLQNTYYKITPKNCFTCVLYRVFCLWLGLFVYFFEMISLLVKWSEIDIMTKLLPEITLWYK